MKLESVQQTINKRESKIQAIVLNGVNTWFSQNGKETVEKLSDYTPLLIKYAIDDWISEYQSKKEYHPDASFSDYIKEQENNFIFSFRQSLTHKAETVYRDAHAVLWHALSTDEQHALLFGLRHLIHETTS